MITIKNNMRLHVLVLISLLTAIWLIYFPMLHGDYYWDDGLIFVNHEELTHDPFSWSAISRPVLPGSAYFRPLVFLSWFAEFHLFGQNPFTSHFINVMMLCLNTVLLYGLACIAALRLGLSNPILRAFLVAGLYAVHPSLVESTAWVSGRFDEMVTFFTLLGLLVFSYSFRDTQTKITIFSSIIISLSFFCALLSKELGIIFPALVLIFYFGFSFSKNKNLSYKRSLINLISNQKILIILMVISLLVYISMRLISLGTLSTPNPSINWIADSYLELLPLYALSAYTQQSILPFFNLQLLYDIKNIDTSLPGKLYVIFISCLVTSCCIMAFVRKNIFSLWLVLASFASIFLVLYIIPFSISGALIASRFLTLPLAFACMAIVFANWSLPILRPKLRNILVGLVLLMWMSAAILNTHNIIKFWKNDLTLWTWATSGPKPINQAASYNYMIVLMQAQQGKKAKEYFEHNIKKPNEGPNDNSGLDPSEQLMYASILLSLDDKNSLNYFEGLAESLPKYYQEDIKRSDLMTRRFAMTPYGLLDVYYGYANALIRIKGDFKKAMEQIQISVFYAASRAEADKPLSLQAIIYYFLGEEKKSLQIYNEQKERSHLFKNTSYLFIPNYIRDYCKKHKKDNTQCKKFEEKNIFD